MTQSLAQIIAEHEKRLRQAMLNSDFTELENLLAPTLEFTNHLGQKMSKQDDLNLHQSGVLKIKKLELDDQNISVYDQFAVVTVKARISAVFSGEESENSFRFTRIWYATEPEKWQIIAGHSCLIS